VITKLDLDLTIFKELILASCGLNFENDRERTLELALKQRMRISGLDAASYYSRLQSNKEEFQQLIDLLTVNETYFFREAGHLAVVLNRLIPDLLKTRKTKTIKIISAGCSTGEEPYTIAIMLREKYGGDVESLFSISGVDIDKQAITTARQGLYYKSSFRNMDEIIKNRYFMQSGNNSWQLTNDVKKLVTFDIINLFDRSYSECMQQADIILYRNVSIYFPKSIQQEIFKNLAELLQDGGYLIVSATETIHHNIGILTLVEIDSLFMYQKIQGLIFEERRKQRRTESLTKPGATETATFTSLKKKISSSGLKSENHSRDKKIIEADQGGCLCFFDDAMELVSKNKIEDAISVLDKLIKLYPEFINALLLKSLLFLDLEQYSVAQAVCNQIFIIDQMNVKGLLLQGIIARQIETNDDAIKYFRQCIYLDNDCWPAHFYLAELVFSANDNRRSKSGYKSAIRILNSESGIRDSKYFPLAFKKELFIAVCNHKLTLMKKGQSDNYGI